MKKLKLLLIISLMLIATSCNTGNSEIALANKLKIIRWGPEETKVGVVVNEQPDGKMGIWIDVVTTEGLGEVKVLFAGKSMLTAIQPKLITAGIPTQELSSAGEKKVEIQSLETGEIITVGTFKITP